MDVLFIVSSALYIFFIGIILFGLNKTNKNPIKFNGKVTIVIPFRNEEGNLELLLTQLIDQQEFIHKIILADDHSEDRSFQIALSFEKEHPELFKYIKIKSRGKKQALREGIFSAETEWIITLDADVLIKKNWLVSLMNYAGTGNAELLCGPVIIHGRSVFDKIQSLDLMAMVAAGTGLGNAGFPFICNGCNMVFRKNTWIQLMDQHSSLTVASGDDVFFLHEIISKHGASSVYFAWHSDAAVVTQGSTGIGEFAMQRIRWGKKSVYYKNATGLLISFFVLFNSLLTLVSLSIIFFYPPIRVIALIYLLCRFVSDYLLLFLACRKMNEKRMIGYFPIAFLFHQLYVPLIAILSLIIRPKWKGRIV